MSIGLAGQKIVLLCTMFFAGNSAVGSTPVAPQSLCDRMLECREHYSKYQCSTFADNPASSPKVITCSSEDLSKSGDQTLGELAKACGLSVKKSVVEMIDGIQSIPDKISHNFNRHIEAQKAAQEICTEKLSFGHKEVWDEFHAGKKQKMKAWASCTQHYSALILDYKFPQIPSLQEMADGLSEINHMRRCFTASAQIEVVCPVLASFLAGGVGGFVAKRAFLSASSAVASRGAQAKKVTAYVDELRAASTASKEARSIHHQEDLLAATKSRAAQASLKEIGINTDQIQLGMLDSDAGKILNIWKGKVLTPSASSDELLNVLAGRSSSSASNAMKEIMSDGGFGSKTLLNADLTNAELRLILEQNGALRAYLHEAPGLSAAIEDLNLGKCSVAEFKERVKANLFHNGPHAGFWKTMGEQIVPSTMNNSEKTTKSFFKNTVFEGKQNAEGVIMARYPGPISPEGVYHTIADRLSQGSRGGMLKILDELGPANKLLNLEEMLIGNPQKTLAQLQGLEEHLAKMEKVTTKQRDALNKVSADARRRLEVQNDFILKGMKRTPPTGPLEKIELSFVDENGLSKKILVEANSSAEETSAALNRFMTAEERAHGDPMTDFIKLKSKALSLVAKGGAAALAPIPLGCSPRSGSSNSAAPKTGNSGVGAH